ncbi:MAG: NADPH-dependent F420 reductase [Woeseiaceae bacterium]|nr:NADPH-dependent F420 reductase [Woeseiaceae bacterium]
MRRLILTAILLAAGQAASADTIAIIGTGDVAGALGPEFAAQGHTIVYGSRNPDRDSVQELVAKTGDGASSTTQTEAVVDADIVVLAVPGMLVAKITESLGDLSGKIIIDPTNPMFRGDAGLEHAVDTSNAEIIQAVAPDAFVVKAFNTLNWRTMVEPDSSGGPVSIPLAGDSADAKETVATLCRGMGLDPIDVGGVENAHWVEGMLILWINNRYTSDRDSFDFYLRRTP